MTTYGLLEYPNECLMAERRHTATIGFWVDWELSEDPRRRCELWNSLDKCA